VQRGVVQMTHIHDTKQLRLKAPESVADGRPSPRRPAGARVRARGTSLSLGVPKWACIGGQFDSMHRHSPAVKEAAGVLSIGVGLGVGVGVGFRQYKRAEGAGANC